MFLLILCRQSPVNNDRTLSELFEPWNPQKWPCSDPTESRLEVFKSSQRCALVNKNESRITGDPFRYDMNLPGAFMNGLAFGDVWRPSQRADLALWSPVNLVL
eukprot:s643_g15.t1